MTDTPEKTVLVAVDENGNRVGEDNARAKLSNHEVDLIRDLWEEGRVDPSKRLSLREIADKFETSKGHIHDIVNFRRRGAWASSTRRVPVRYGDRDTSFRPSEGPKAGGNDNGE
jgi:hypothetical protein